jgi:hypothetical protein
MLSQNYRKLCWIRLRTPRYGKHKKLKLWRTFHACAKIRVVGLQRWLLGPQRPPQWIKSAIDSAVPSPFFFCLECSLMLSGVTFMFLCITSYRKKARKKKDQISCCPTLFAPDRFERLRERNSEIFARTHMYFGSTHCALVLSDPLRKQTKCKCDMYMNRKSAEGNTHNNALINHLHCMLLFKSTREVPCSHLHSTFYV